MIREIDGLRAVAILSVLVFHAGGNFFVYTNQSVGVGMTDAWLTTLLSAGEFGVPLFFAISGFVLALPFAQQRICRTSPVSLRKYFTRRLTRLEPPYFLALLGAFVAMSLRDHNLQLWPNLLASMFYLHNTVFGEPSKVLGVAWSLEVEVQFYILAPLICCVFSIRRVWLRRLFVMSGMAAASVLFEVERPIEGLFLPAQLAYFLSGLLLADLFLVGVAERVPLDRRGTKGAIGAMVVGLGWDVVATLAIGLVFITKAGDFHQALFAPWLMLIGYTSVFRAFLIRRLITNVWVVITGGMCYTIYLWHFLIIPLFRHAWFKIVDPHPNLIDRAVYVAVSVALSLVISALLFALVEKPTMDQHWPAKLAAWFRSRLGAANTNPPLGTEN